MLVYHGRGKLYVGGVQRLHIHYSSDTAPHETLYVRVKNCETQFLKLGYLYGPYTLYVSARSASFTPMHPLQPGEMTPVYEPHLKASSSWHAELPLHGKNSSFILDIMSQIIFTTVANVHFEVFIGFDMQSTLEERQQVGVFHPSISVVLENEKQLWAEPALLQPHSHLVVLTHGLHSNAPADLLFLKESIVSASGDPVVVRSLDTNACKTERGVKFLGRRVGQYILSLMEEDTGRLIDKISFVGHSLGGLVNVYALAWIKRHNDQCFEHWKPIHFITIATPFLGISSENPLYVRFALDFGVVGKTGQDLSLLPPRALLRMLPNGPARSILKMFSRRTIYANVVNDGIVPLRTACLLFLDWRGLGTVEKAKRENNWNWGLNSQTTSIKPNVSDPLSGSVAADTEPDEDHSSKVTANLTSLPLPQITVSTDDLDNYEVDKAPSSGTSITPFTSLRTLLRPQAGKLARRKPSRIYVRSQIVGNADGDWHVPPRTTVWESASDILNPPLPTNEFITDPSSRPKCIFHDRMYHPKDIPSPTSFPDSPPDSKKAKQKAEEKIARAYHESMSWRKVLVRLEPDAHNNIIVRRMFANAYGWDVIAHLVANHFSSEIMDDLESERPNTASSTLSVGIQSSNDSVSWDESAFHESENDN